MSHPTSDSRASHAAILGTVPLGPPPWPTRDPFLFCVHHDDAYPAGNEVLGPRASLAGRNLGMDFAGKDGWRMYHGDRVPGFPQHPHRGFETVTVVRQGVVDHSDSLGATGRYGSGDVQWMTAGRGIQHAEMFPLVHEDRPNPLELFQIWLNLPAARKMVDPYFTMLWSHSIPSADRKDAQGRSTRVTIAAGAYEDLVPPSPPPDSWASQPGSEVAIWTLRLSPGAAFALPAAKAGVNRTLYGFRGAGLRIAGHGVPERHLVDLRPDLAVTLEATAGEVELLLLQGRPLGEPVVQYGPFVMNTREEIAQAVEDLRRDRYGTWPWDRPDPVHPRQEGRLARHTDGRLERPPAGGRTEP